MNLRAELNNALFGGVADTIEDAEYERALIADARNGDDRAFVRLLRAYAPRLRALTVGRYGFRTHDSASTKPTYDDLRAAALDALWTAIVQFDQNGPAERLAAVMTDRSAARRAADDVLQPTARIAGAVSVPTNTLYSFYSAINAAADHDAEVADKVRAAMKLADSAKAPTLSAKTIQLIDTLTNSRSYVYLNSDVEDFEDKVYADDLAAQHEFIEDPRYTATVEATALSKMLAEEALAVLSEDQSAVVRRAYGFAPESYREMSDGEIAEDLKDTKGYSRPTVCRIRNRALRDMRVALHVEEGTK